MQQDVYLAVRTVNLPGGGAGRGMILKLLPGNYPLWRRNRGMGASLGRSHRGQRHGCYDSLRLKHCGRHKIVRFLKNKT
jgi:hypothetical protein